MPSIELKQRIERFIAVFHEYICRVASVSLGEGDERYRKLLYFSILEGLAKARYPRKRPGAGFASFVVTYCGWSDGERVSLPHLVAALERTAEPAFTALRDEAFSRYRAWGSGGPRSLENDPTKPEIQKLWPDKDGQSLTIPELSLTWADFQHRSLLYAYRSKLTHESREPTLGFDTALDLSPFYESVQPLPPIGEQYLTEWHLVYPSGFLVGLCHTGIEALKAHCLGQSKDPYESFRFGQFLLDCLNDTDRYPIRFPFSSQLQHGANGPAT